MERGDTGLTDVDRVGKMAAKCSETSVTTARANRGARRQNRPRLKRAGGRKNASRLLTARRWRIGHDRHAPAQGPPVSVTRSRPPAPPL